jgi:hypothetical protein
MTLTRRLITAAALVAGTYAVYVAQAWARYGHTASTTAGGESDPLVDRFMPAWDVAEHHHVRVAAPAALTLKAAREMDLFHQPVVRALFNARAFILGAPGETGISTKGLLKDAQAIGWGILADVSGREVVVGAVTKPWEAHVTFRSVPPDEFAAFNEPGYVKIVWTLRADPVSESESIFHTETRVATTDAAARAKFRRYWACVSPGIILIRWLGLQPVKRAAEQRAAANSRRDGCWLGSGFFGRSRPSTDFEVPRLTAAR